MTRFTISIGLFDKDTKRQKFSENIAKNIVYSGSKINVKMTMIGGRILYEYGSFLIDEKPEDIYEKANEIIAGIK